MLADLWIASDAIRVTLEGMSASPIELPLEERASSTALVLTRNLEDEPGKTPRIGQQNQI
jgi:hypothetical protein